MFQPQKEEDTQRHSDSSLEEKVFKQAPKELTEEKRRSARRREYDKLTIFSFASSFYAPGEVLARTLLQDLLSEVTGCSV